MSNACAVPGCYKTGRCATGGKHYCSMHYMRLYKHGNVNFVLKKQRSCNEVSKIIILTDHAEVELTCGKRALIDIVDIELINKYNWYWSNTTGYAYSNKIKTSMQQFLVGKAPPGKIIEHDDRNKLNNRRANLIFKTQSANNRNSTRADNGGVAYHALSQKYQAYITINYKNVYLGLYEKRAEALSIRQQAMKLAEEAGFNLEEFQASWKLFRTREQEELKRDE